MRLSGRSLTSQPVERILRFSGFLYRHMLIWLLHQGIRSNGLVRIGPGFRIMMRDRGVVRIGLGCEFDMGLTLECRGTLDIGANTFLGHHCTLAVRERVMIGHDCLIAEMVSIRDHDHSFRRLDVPVRLQGVEVSPVTIGNNVWIGSKASILRGVKIGDNAVIGANAVVNREIPPNAIAVGVPARVVRLRSNQN